MRRLYLFVLVIALCPCTHASPEIQPTYNALFERIWATVHERFYDPSFVGVDWNAVRIRYERRLTLVKTDSEFISLMREMLHELPVSHLGVHPPETEAKVGLAVTTADVAGEQLICSVDVPSDAERQGLRAGDVLLTPEEMLEGAWGTRVNVRVDGCDGKVRTMLVRREPEGWPHGMPSLRWRKIRPTPQTKIGYMQIVHFEDDFAPLADKAMEDLRDTEGLIIDVRNNSGGNASFLRLVSYFTPQAQFAFALLSRTFLEKVGKAPEYMPPESIEKLPRVSGAYTTAAILNGMKSHGGGAAFYTENLGPNAYRGKIAVLINAETGSAAEVFAKVMESLPNAVSVGRRTEGAVLGSEQFDLPGGWSLSVPTHAGWTPDGHLWRDKPLMPAIEVPLTRRDLCDGFDADMAKALGLLEGT
jgi:carboxyl-terminal processing protease